MKKKLIDFLLKEDVVFEHLSNKEYPDYLLSGEANSLYFKVFGNTKEEILEKMILTKKEHLKISKLLTEDEFIEKFKKGTLHVNLNKTYKLKYARFIGEEEVFVEEKTGFDILNDLFSTMYFYLDITSLSYDSDGNACYNFRRRKNSIDYTLWGKYDKIIKYNGL